jgi:hypothetical protein
MQQPAQRPELPGRAPSILQWWVTLSTSNYDPALSPYLLCLISTAIVSALVGALAAKLNTRWLTTCANVPCKYLQIRLAVINQMIATRVGARDYLVIGDSLTEIARWPTMCGHDPLPAGISGARSDTWLPHAKTIADILKPDLVVLALGTNDVLTQGRLGPYEQLAFSLSGYRLVAVPIHKACRKMQCRRPTAALREQSHTQLRLSTLTAYTSPQRNTFAGLALLRRRCAPTDYHGPIAGRAGTGSVRH